MKYGLRAAVAALFAAAILLFYPIYGGSTQEIERVPVYLRYETADRTVFEKLEAVSVSSKSAVLIDADSGRILYSKNPYTELPMASTTKIMTAVLILEQLPPESTVTVTAQSTGIEGSSIYLMEGEKLTVSELIYGLMLRSGNDAANTLAIACAGSVSRFAEMMNAKAAELGLKNTHFINPSGLPAEGHYTTADDLAKLAAYAIRNPEFTAVTSTVRTVISNGTRYLVNRNDLLRTYEGLIGVKTGYTKAAGRCLVTAAKRDGVTLVAVSLGGGDNFGDHRKMLDFGFGYLKSVRFASTGEITAEIPVTGGASGTVRILNTDALDCCVPQNSESVTVIRSPRFVYAPVSAGEIIGEATVTVNGEAVASVPLVAECDVAQEKYSLFERLFG